MTIFEMFPPPVTKAEKLFWLPGYVALSREVFDGYTRHGETVERHRHVGNCASRWGITRACAEAILTGEATYEVTPENIIIIRTVKEE